MKINIIADSDGDYGMGHIVRQHRLAQVLRQRGASIGFYLDEDNAERGRALVAGFALPTTADEALRYCDTMIVDVMENDDEIVQYLRPFCEQLIVFVGVGSTITPDTYWIADYVIWQSMETYQNSPSIFCEKVRTGKNWLILSPSLRDAEIPKERNEGVAVYFGGGVSEAQVVPSLQSQETWCLGREGDWQKDIGEQLLNSRSFLGTMGMVAYEAMAAGLRPLVVSRSEDHLQTANRLQQSNMAWSLGLAEDWDIVSTKTAADILAGKELDLRVRDYSRPDGWGAWRIAELILTG